MASFSRKRVVVHTVGREGEFITAFQGVSNFDLYDLRHLIEQNPRWMDGPVGRKSRSCRNVENLLPTLLHADIQKQVYYEVLPLEAAM